MSSMYGLKPDMNHLHGVHDPHMNGLSLQVIYQLIIIPEKEIFLFFLKLLNYLNRKICYDFDLISRESILIQDSFDIVAEILQIHMINGHFYEFFIAQIIFFILCVMK